MAHTPVKSEVDYNTCSEAMLYFCIEDLGGLLWWQIHESADGRVPANLEWEKKTQATLEAAVDQTARFGVSEPRIEGMGASDEYRAWYRWWHDWHQGMTGEEWAGIDARIKQGDRLLNTRPDGAWKAAAAD